MRPSIHDGIRLELQANCLWHCPGLNTFILAKGVDLFDLREQLKASAHSLEHSKLETALRDARKGRPVKWRYLIKILDALNALPTAYGKSDSWHGEDTLVGALFFLADFGGILTSTGMSAERFATVSKLPRELIDDVIAGKRITLVTALAFLRQINNAPGIRAHRYFSPLDYVCFDTGAGTSRSAAKGYVVEDGPYDFWPPQGGQLLAQDLPPEPVAEHSRSAASNSRGSPSRLRLLPLAEEKGGSTSDSDV